MAYDKQTWETGEVISAERLNHMEDGIAEAGSSSGGGLTNMVNGSAAGSVRGINTASEDSSYTMGTYAFAEGNGTKAIGNSSHAEGVASIASGHQSHAEGNGAQATGNASHAEGNGAQATGDTSHAEGHGTIAQGHCQHVSGEYNIAQGTKYTHADSDYAVIVGNGSSKNARSNAFAMKWDGTFVFANGTEITPAQFASLLALLNN